MQLMVNGVPHEIDMPDDTPLVWALRDGAGLTGTKLSCSIGLCGACTVHVNGEAARSCVLTLQSVAGKQITTIEGMKEDHPVVLAWITEDVAQCGYCQPGFVMAASALLVKTPKPTDAQVDAALTNICRCGTYPRVRSAVKRAVSGSA
jgi:isoquinoline 1-oxidoreductase subunit alpha